MDVTPKNKKEPVSEFKPKEDLNVKVEEKKDLPAATTPSKPAPEIKVPEEKEPKTAVTKPLTLIIQNERTDTPNTP